MIYFIKGAIFHIHSNKFHYYVGMDVENSTLPSLARQLP